MLPSKCKELVDKTFPQTGFSSKLPTVSFSIETHRRRHALFAQRAKICMLAACEQAPRRFRGKTEPVPLRVAQENAIRRAGGAARERSTPIGVLFSFSGGVLTEKMSFCKCIYEKNEIINMLFDHIIVIVRRYSLGVCSAIFLKTRLKFRRESKPHSSATLKIVLLEYRKRKRASLTR